MPREILAPVVAFLVIAAAATVNRFLADGSGEGSGRAGRMWTFIPGPLAAVGGGLGIILAFLAVEGWPGWPLPERWHRLVHLAALGMLAGAVAGAVRSEARGVLMIAGLAAAIGAAALVDPLDRGFSPPVVRVVLGLSVLVLWVIVLPLVHRRGGGWVLPAFGFALLAGFYVLLESRFAKIAILAGLTGAICLACWPLLLVSGRIGPAARQWLAGLAGVMCIWLPSIMLTGSFYNFGGVPRAAFVLTALGPTGLAVVYALDRFQRVGKGSVRAGGAWYPIGLLIAISILPAAAIILTIVPAS